MKSATAILLCCSLVIFSSCRDISPCREYENLVLSSAILEKDVPYSVILPHDYSSRKSYPLIVAFHCIGGDHTTCIQYCDFTHTLDSLVKAHVCAPAIVLMPDIEMSYCADAYDGSASYETMLLSELIPEVESRWNVSGKRFTLGFSMGGFAAMSIALRHPGDFCGYAAMSPSVRTDAQYCSEMPQEEWDRQWGSKFGAVGKTGSERLTKYYKERCPLHLLEDLPLDSLSRLGHFITVGNREGGSLASSNEALHLSLLSRGISHYWKVSDGGHDFSFWRRELPEALRFADCCFKSEEFVPAEFSEPCGRRVPDFVACADGSHVYYPYLDYQTTRKFPTVYVFGASNLQELRIMAYYNYFLRHGMASPIVFCFTSVDNFRPLELCRDSQRMRSAICFGPAASQVQNLMCGENLFTNVVFVEPACTMDADIFARTIRSQKRYPKIIIAASSSSADYSCASLLHVALKDADAAHYHYSYPEKVPVLWHFPHWLRIIDDKFHD